MDCGGVILAWIILTRFYSGGMMMMAIIMMIIHGV